MGNCLFDSLNATLRVASAHALRVALCEYVAQHPALFERDVRALGHASVAAYCAHMCRNGVDGDHVMLAAASHRYAPLRIDVLMPNGRTFTVGTDDADRVALLRWVPGHYSAIGAAVPPSDGVRAHADAKPTVPTPREGARDDDAVD